MQFSLAQKQSPTWKTVCIRARMASQMDIVKTSIQIACSRLHSFVVEWMLVNLVDTEQTAHFHTTLMFNISTCTSSFSLMVTGRLCRLLYIAMGAGLPKQYHPIVPWLPRITLKQVWVSCKNCLKDVIGYC